MKLYVYIFKRLDLKRFEIFKNIPSNCRPQFLDFSQRYRLYYYYFSILRLFFYITAIFFSKILAILLRVLLNSRIKCIVCICVSFLYICLTSETLHYPWICDQTPILFLRHPVDNWGSSTTHYAKCDVISGQNKKSN